MESRKNKSMIFIDGQNIFYGARDNNLKIAYERIRDYFKNRYNVIEMRYYSAYESDHIDQMNFLNMICDFGYTLKIKPLRIIERNGRRKKEEKKIDVWLTTELIKDGHNNNYDLALVLGGDTDFIPAYEYLLTLNKGIEIWTWENRSSNELENFAENNSINVSLHLLDDIKESIII